MQLSVLICCEAELALLIEGLGVVAESHLEEWLVRPAKKSTENDDPADENHTKTKAHMKCSNFGRHRFLIDIDYEKFQYTEYCI